MATDRAIRFTFIGEDKSAGRTMSRLANQSDSLGAKLAGFGRTVAKGVGIVAAGGIAAFGAAMAQGVKDAANFEVLAKKTEAVIKSTGNVANISKKGVQDLAASLESMSGVDEELIINSQNVLATFTNIRNEAGKGNKIFDLSTQAILDISVALGQDMQSSTIQVGKALNDPIKGITALSRVGVSFTDQQKEQIKTLVESGDVLGAQKVILQELQKEFGGAAAAAGDTFEGKIARLKDTFGDFFRELGTRLLPVLGQFADWLRTEGIVYLERFGTFLSTQVVPVLVTFGQFVRDEIVPRLIDFGKWLREEVVPRLADLGGWIVKNKDFFIPFIAALAAALAGFKAFMFIKTVTAAVAAFNAMLLANPIGLVVAALAALVAGLVYAYQKSETFRDIVDGALRFIAEAAQSFWNDFLKPVFDAFGAALEWIGDKAEWLGEKWDLFWEVAKTTTREAIRRIVDSFLGFVDTILQGAEQAFGWVPEIGPKLDEAHDEFAKFRRKVNNELGAIDDEAVKINVKTYGNLEFGGAGGRGGAGISMGVGGAGGAAPSHQAAGGDLDVIPTGLSARAIADMATDFVGQTKSAVMKSIEKAFAAAPGAGRFLFPLRRGSYRVGRGVVGHGYPAWDFPAPIGTPVFAPFTGYFSPVNLGNRSYGKYANLVAGPWRFIGAHLSRFARGAGPVGKGSLLGFVGSTGNSTGPHLHVEFRRNGARLNPRNVLSFANGGVIAEHVVGVGMRSGRPYEFGENGPERVTPGTGRNVDERSLRRALEGMTLVLEDRRGQTVARLADMYGRGG